MRIEYRHVPDDWFDVVHVVDDLAGRTFYSDLGLIEKQGGEWGWLPPIEFAVPFSAWELADIAAKLDELNSKEMD